MQEILEAEQQTDESDSRPQLRQRKHSKCKREVLSDPEDKPYNSTASLGSDSESESESSIMGIMPDEVSFGPLDCRLCYYLC